MDESQDQPQTTPPRPTRRLSLSNLVLWLLLVPVVFGTLIFFSELAFILNLQDLAADTRSLLQAQYNPWPYDEIPPINIEALISDIQKDIKLFGTPAVIPTIEIGEFLKPPTAAATEIRQPTETPETPKTAAPSVTQTTAAKTSTAIPVRTKTTIPTATRTKAPVVPTNTNTATATATATTTLLPLWTFTPVPSNTPENATPTRPRPTRTFTPTFTPTKKIPPTFTFTATTEVPVPPTEIPTVTTPVTYLPVRPIAENSGQSIVDPDGKGCLAYFGYRNDNPVEIDIPIGDRNHLSGPTVRIGPESEQPTHFYTDRVSPAFEVVWNIPGSFSWVLDGREAVMKWCNP
jgi:hypothetical protein